MNQKSKAIVKNVFSYFSFVLIFWLFYRYLFPNFLDTTDEFLVKPLIWLTPLIYFLKKEGRGLKSLGISDKNLFPSIYFALLLGVIFTFVAVFLNYAKYGGSFEFKAFISENTFLMTMLLSAATAVTEEIAFRGYVFNRLWEALGNEYLANIVSSSIWTIMYVPITVFILKLDPAAMIVQFLITFAYGVGAAFIFARSKNVFPAILLHFLYEWPIVLFR